MGLHIRRAAWGEESSWRHWYPWVSADNTWRHLKLPVTQPSLGSAHGSRFLHPGATCCPCPATFVLRKGRREEKLPQCLSDFKIKITEFINAYQFTLLLSQERTAGSPWGWNSALGCTQALISTEQHGQAKGRVWCQDWIEFHVLCPLDCLLRNYKNVVYFKTTVIRQQFPAEW